MNPRYSVWKKRQPITIREAWRYVWSREGSFFAFVGFIAFILFPVWCIDLVKGPNQSLTGDVMAKGLLLSCSLIPLIFGPILALLPDLFSRKRFLESVAHPQAFPCWISIKRDRWKTGSDFGVCWEEAGQLVFCGLATGFRLSRSSLANVIRDKPSPRGLTFDLQRSDLSITLAPSSQPLMTEKRRFAKEDWQAFNDSWLSSEPGVSTDELYPPETPSRDALGEMRVFTFVAGALIAIAALIGVLAFAMRTDFEPDTEGLTGQLMAGALLLAIGIFMLVYAIRWRKALKQYQPY